MTSIALAVGLLGLCLATARDAVGSVQPALADTGGCSNQSLHGGYSYQLFAKDVDDSSGTPVVTAYFVEGGLITFNGAGQLTAISEGSFNNVLFGKEVRSGTYTVAPNCTGSFTVTTAGQPCCPSFDIHYDFVMVRGGSQLTLFQRDPGTVSAGSAFKQ